ncbi:sigma-E factor negative regulatory protein [Janthinobacterium sp.]|uniref:sigma-E factor negative regulatory protein n=1 Tax=Janthinobacterium sp. TaxID=1871054 RepID=UPI00293D3F1B|nr:sigma-E factor negative regulatory protein [Janthinobacterium sp.]
METQTTLHDNISALLDGELAQADVELAFAALDTEEGRTAWDAYLRIGHALRSDACGAELSDGFAARLAARLGEEAPLSPPARAGQAQGEGGGAVAPLNSLP